ncbi:MAG: RNB domain-containing ribonuclease [Bacilli bacterium]|nr:RNB domain-containing ribonuclease [Bacilli bacterium]
MNQNIKRFKSIVEDTKNINACIKALNLEFDSCFLCFMLILEDAILEYKEHIDYQYITKVSNYLERVYQKLNIKKQKEYSDLVYKIKKIYKRQIQNINIDNKGYFEQVIRDLNDLINNYIVNKNDILISEDLQREKYMEEYIITIDDADAKVLDDGLSVGILPNNNLLLKVHIADPLVLYPYESDIMKNAKLQVETIYDEDNPVPMIPNEISYQKLSLIQDRKRYSKTFCYEFDRQGNIVNFYIQNSIIKVSERHTYDSMNELYKNGGNNILEETRLSYYDEIVKYLRIMFKNVRDYEEIKIKNLVLNDDKISSFSERLVSYSMVLTGYMTAKYMKEHDLPYAYRCNKLAVIDDRIKMGLTEEEIIKLETILSKSFYTRNNVGHEKLKVDTYSHVSSPLRRFIDNLNMHCLNICYFNTPTDKQIYKLNDEIDSTCDYINNQAISVDEQIIKKLVK